MKRTSTQAQLEDSLGRSAKKLKSFDLNKKLCQALLAANIPWCKLEIPMFRQFLEEQCAISIPDESTLIKSYLDTRYKDVLLKIKSNVQGQPIWIAVDETNDVEGR